MKQRLCNWPWTWCSRENLLWKGLLFMWRDLSVLTAQKEICSYGVYMKKCCSNPLLESLLSVNTVNGLPAVSKRLSWIAQLIQNLSLPFIQKMISSTTLIIIIMIIKTCLEEFPVFLELHRLYLFETKAGSRYWAHVMHWSYCWVTRGIMVQLLLTDFQGVWLHFQTIDVIIYSASVSCWGFYLSCFLSLPRSMPSSQSLHVQLLRLSIMASIIYPSMSFNR